MGFTVKIMHISMKYEHSKVQKALNLSSILHGGLSIWKASSGGQSQALSDSTRIRSVVLRLVVL
jgi:hypothetical protein